LLISFFFWSQIRVILDTIDFVLALKTISTKIGHYSIRNVNKRDEKSKQNSKLISELKRTVRKQNVIVNEHYIQFHVHLEPQMQKFL
jgi:hypothetical protein